MACARKRAKFGLVLDEPGTKIKLPGATQEALKKLPEFKYAG